MSKRSTTAWLVLGALLASAVHATMALSQEARPRRGFRDRGPQVVSPEVSPERRITFRVLA